jgi:putative hydrolase of HD superfamily
VEASLSISHGIKSKELLNGKRETLKSLKVVQGIDFKEIAIQIDKEFGSTGQTQAQMDFD